MAEFDRTAHLQDLFFFQGESDHNDFHRRLEAQGKTCRDEHDATGHRLVSPATQSQRCRRRAQGRPLFLPA
ncbi:hypothetical protein CVV70_16675 [Ralstonia solanacearum]|nr:hypothetical protein CCY86_16375 [Ralstonia solanacearum]OPK46684.1 hypothetical protein B5G54_17920 [Ralstonia solanacearum]OPK51921.1 hypothetical protein B5J95_18725 [Ralstonia solanacearum]OPK53488.1 hypothetical protein B5S37_14685 [Ralstonia solanacearum]OYQ01969.1 hypothetical protein B7R79_17295 [Ralstonia solanacearum]